MEEKRQVSLFREKSLEQVQSPEALNDYLRVTTPGVWLVLAAVVMVLIGAIVWSVFGRIDTSLAVAVAADGEEAVCIIPYAGLEKAMAAGTVSVEGQDYALGSGEEARMLVITEQTNPYILLAGKLSVGDVTVEVPLEAQLPAGVYAGSVLTESLQPISLLLR